MKLADLIKEDERAIIIGSPLSFNNDKKYSSLCKVLSRLNKYNNNVHGYALSYPDSLDVVVISGYRQHDDAMNSLNAIKPALRAHTRIILCGTLPSNQTACECPQAPTYVGELYRTALHLQALGSELKTFKCDESFEYATVCDAKGLLEPVEVENSSTAENINYLSVNRTLQRSLNVQVPQVTEAKIEEDSDEVVDKPKRTRKKNKGK